MRKKSMLCLIVLSAGLFMIYRLIWIPGWDKREHSLEEKSRWEQVIALPERNDGKALMEDLPRMIEKCRQSFTGNGINVAEVKMGGRDSEAEQIYLNMRWQGPWGGILQGLIRLEEEGIAVREVNLNQLGGEGRLEIGKK